jgi:hypothetical protein
MGPDEPPPYVSSNGEGPPAHVAWEFVVREVT